MIGPIADTYAAAGVPVPPPWALAFNRAGDAGRRDILTLAGIGGAHWYAGRYFRQLPPRIAAAVADLWQDGNASR